VRKNNTCEETRSENRFDGMACIVSPKISYIVR